MTMQEAPTKAREGGYQHNFTHCEPSMRLGVVGLHAFSTMQMDDLFLDLECWRALGRTLGWHHERVWRGQLRHVCFLDVYAVLITARLNAMASHPFPERTRPLFQPTHA